MLAFIFTLIVGAANAAPVGPVYNFTLLPANRPSVTLVSDVVQQKWTDPNTPSCEVFQFRVAHFLKQQEELDNLLEKMSKRKGPPYTRLFREFTELAKRQQKVERELKRQSLELTIRYSLPKDDANREWIEKRNYKLTLYAPDLMWNGLDATEPESFQLNLSPDSLEIRQRFTLGEICNSNSAFEASLVERP